jgi:hypothetical protein
MENKRTNMVQSAEARAEKLRQAMKRADERYGGVFKRLAE